MQRDQGNGHDGPKKCDERNDQSLLQSVETATSAWLEQMAAMRRVETEFATRLAASRTASEAVSICTEWLAKRVDSLVAVQHHLIDLWLQGQAGQLERGATRKPTPETKPPRSKERPSS